MRALATVLLLLTACPERLQVAGRAERAVDHIEAFRSFERWAHRTLSAEVEMRDRDARREALFAPLHLEGGVGGVRVVDRETFEFRRPPGEQTQWSTIRLEGEEFELAEIESAIALARDGRVGDRPIRVEMVFPKRQDR